jgi:hypothetical protein
MRIDLAGREGGGGYENDTLHEFPKPLNFHDFLAFRKFFLTSP